MECQHEGCACQVEGGGFCSSYCEEHAAHAPHEEAHVCECGHPECQPAPTV
jgi:hypothetical protein